MRKGGRTSADSAPPRALVNRFLLAMLGLAVVLLLAEAGALLYIIALKTTSLARHEAMLAALLLGVAAAFSLVLAWAMTRAVRDETAVRLAESERRRELTRRLIDISPMGVALIDVATRRYVLTNPSYERNTGARVNMAGHRIGEFTPPKISGFINWLFDKVVTTGEPFSVREFEADLGPGREKTWWNNDVIPLHGRDGRIESVLALTHEVTDQVLIRKRTEELAAANRTNAEALAQSEERLRLATEVAGVGTWDWDIVRSRLTWSRRCREIFGVSEQSELTEELFLSRIHPEDRAKFDVPRERWVHGEYSDEYRVVWPDGSVHWVLSMGRSFQDEHGRPNRALGVVMDITARKEAEARLKQFNDYLEQEVAERTSALQRQSHRLQKLIYELNDAEERERRRLAQALHDHLQQLLVGAKLAIEMVRKEAPNGRAREGLDRAQGLVDESIQSSRSLTVELSPPVVYKEQLPGALRWLAEWIKEKHALTVSVDIDERADPGSEQLRLFLFHAIRELLFNVVKHAHVDRASVRVIAGDGQIKAIVSDAGVGFDLGKTSEVRGVETGFGLFSIKQRAAMIDGEVEVWSAPGRGSRVTITLPTAATPASVG